MFFVFVTVPDMTYNVFSGTLNPTRSIRLCCLASLKSVYCSSGNLINRCVYVRSNEQSLIYLASRLLSRSFTTCHRSCHRYLCLCAMCAKECEYGDREQWCQDIYPNSCYLVADSCCQTCPELRIQDAQPGKAVVTC